MPRRGGDVPPRLLERAPDGVALESGVRLLEKGRARCRLALIELREVDLVGEILVGDPLLVAHRHEALDQVLELADVAGPPVPAEDPHGGLGDALDALA